MSSLYNHGYHLPHDCGQAIMPNCNHYISCGCVYSIVRHHSHQCIVHLGPSHFPVPRQYQAINPPFLHSMGCSPTEAIHYSSPGFCGPPQARCQGFTESLLLQDQPMEESSRCVASEPYNASSKGHGSSGFSTKDSQKISLIGIQKNLTSEDTDDQSLASSDVVQAPSSVTISSADGSASSIRSLSSSMWAAKPVAEVLLEAAVSPKTKEPEKLTTILQPEAPEFCPSSIPISMSLETTNPNRLAFRPMVPNSVKTTILKHIVDTKSQTAKILQDGASSVGATQIAVKDTLHDSGPVKSNGPPKLDWNEVWLPNHTLSAQQTKKLVALTRIDGKTCRLSRPKNSLENLYADKTANRCLENKDGPLGVEKEPWWYQLAPYC